MLEEHSSEQVPQWVQAERPIIWRLRRLAGVVLLVAGDPFDDKAHRGGKDVKHFAKGQPGKKGQTGKNMQVPEHGYRTGVTENRRKGAGNPGQGKAGKGISVGGMTFDTAAFVDFDALGDEFRGQWY